MTPEFMLITFVLFLAGVLAVPIASRFGLGSVLGYLIAGILIGPFLTWVGADVVSLQHFAEFGVVMMLFIVGLEMNPKALWQMRGRIFVLGGLQVGVTTALVMAVAMAFGQTWTVGLAIGLIFALSSTAIVNQTLKEKGLLKSDGGQSSFAVLLFQDIAVIPMLALVPLLALPELMEAAHLGAGHDDHGSGLNLSLVEGLNGWQTALVTLAAIGGVIAAGQYLVGPIFRFVARARLRELYVTTALMIVLGIALLMTMVGLSPALGTFLAGVVLAGNEFRHELESDIDPFRGIFLGVFFITVGASIDFALLWENLGLVLGLTFGLIALKAIVLLSLARAFRLTGGDKWLFGLGMAQAGEFGFVLISYSVANFVLPGHIADLLLLVVALTMLLTPALFILYDRVIAPRYSRQQEQEADEIDSEAQIVVAGHGRFGGIVNRALRGAGYETTVVDYSAEQLAILRRFGLHVFFGDATRPDLLHAAGIDEAKVLVVAIDDKEAITGLVRYVTEHHPNVHVIARAIDRWHVYDLWSVGCRDIIREVFDSSLRATRSAFEALGHSRTTAQGLVDAFNDMDRKTMLELADLYDINIPPQENEPYVARVRDMQSEWETELRGNMEAVTAGE
ncbi:monovalent cation:proton antiporter-2 (CPA2) family protein [Aliiroseovarius sp. KMU-50]|uniref:Monovalent cation:proton antiporter-2 (CPA2) family protein n=1 Tax=Aliiroseovarius salicola TaxID=3009082 RepID=A0ABT4VZB4_9RHOB|nr:monovalent cation:proton antiporter-2 (CPA2) family protein [Aliiroseovarius sp. KMU-50]MDA5093590.1 monovalent cation:proton antiporter-2 (CPA2) family protein [Aliiroseovarius sp. KMU-50]